MVDLGEILSHQLFQVMDRGQNGFLDRDDFIAGVFRLCKGSDRDKFMTLFEVMDFGGKGYISSEDVRTIVFSLPSLCPRCEEPVSYPWVADDILFNVFRDTGAHSYESLWSILPDYQSFFTDLLTTITMSLPTVIFDILSVNDRLNCSYSHPFLTSPEENLNLCPLQYRNKSYFFTFREGCLYGFSSSSLDIPKIIIFTKGLFISPVENTQFELRNSVAVYNFTANSAEIRDKWVEMLISAQKYRFIDDFYDIREMIGEGGQAKVYISSSRGSGQSSAVKIVSKLDLCIKSEERIRREISILRLIRHPNVLQLYDVFETSERFYIVTEVLEESLFTCLERMHFETKEAFAKSVVLDIANGLVHLHSNHIMHRDLKLENVMLRKTKGGVAEAVLIDFGLSCFLGPEQRATEPVGTLKYAAPEVLSRLPYGYKADCWSLGVILFILLIGKMPFYGKTDQEIAGRILRRRINVSTERWQHISAEGKSAVEGLLTRKAEDRWDMEELLRCKWLTGSDTEEAGSTGTEGTAQLPLGGEVAAGESC